MRSKTNKFYNIIFFIIPNKKIIFPNVTFHIIFPVTP